MIKIKVFHCYDESYKTYSKRFKSIEFMTNELEKMLNSFDENVKMISVTPQYEFSSLGANGYLTVVYSE